MIRLIATPVPDERGPVEVWRLAVILIRAKLAVIDCEREYEAEEAEVIVVPAKRRARAMTRR